jgi:hypothetical protein
MLAEFGTAFGVHARIVLQRFSGPCKAA